MLTAEELQNRLEKVLGQKNHGIITEGELTEKLVSLVRQGVEALREHEA